MYFKEKSFWLGKNFKEEGVKGNNITYTNVPNIRVAYRFEAITTELNLLLKITSKYFKTQNDVNSQ